MRASRISLVIVLGAAHAAMTASTAPAAPVVGKLELPPPPERPAVVARGFVDRVENPVAPVRPPNVGAQMIVVLEGGPPPVASGQVVWEVVGESFARPVIAAPVGAEVVIRNASRTARTLVAAEDPKLIQAGPLNPTGTRSFRPTAPAVYTIGDRDAPHLRGTLVVVATPYIAHVEVTGSTGRFELPDVPEGDYKLRIFYKDNWIDRPDEAVHVPAKGKAEVSVKVPAGYPLKK